MDISLRQLRAFSTVARLGSFAEAARSMYLTPAALSILVRDLEAEVGFRLFHRTTRRVELSEQGRRYLEYGERVLDDLRMAERMADEIRNQRMGLVRMAMTPLMHVTLLPSIIRAFRQQWPQVRIDLVDVPSERLLGCVESGQADLAVAFEMPVGEALEAAPLFISRLHAVMHPAHRLGARRSLRWNELQGEALIFIGRSMELRVRSELPQGIQLDAQYSANNSITAFALVASGAGVAIGPGYARPIAVVHDLRLVPLKQPVIDRRFMLYRLRSASASPAVEACHGFLLQHFGRFAKRPIEFARQELPAQ